MSHPFDAKNLLDRAIEAVAPAWAAERYASRARIDFTRQVQFSPTGVPSASYRGAIGTRTATTWGTSSSYRGGTSQDRQQQGSMRDRGRRVYRENVIGRSLLDTETDNVVSAGFSLQMKTIAKAFNAEAEKRFYDWLDSCDVAGKFTASDWFRTSWREPRKDGDGGIILVQRGGRPMLQYCPGDRIINPLERYDPFKLFDGIECDPAGKAIRFWVRDDTELMPNYSAVPIEARDFVFLSHRDDPLAIRGSSVYGPIFPELDQLDGYKEAVIIAARMGCMFGLIEKRKNPAAATANLLTATNSQGNQQKVVTLENGMIKVLSDSDDLLQVQASQPMQQVPDFLRAIMRIIALRFDMPIEIGQKDLSQVNFSGGRIGLIAYYRSCRVKQDWLKSRCWNRIVFWWLSKERQRQQLGFDDAFKAPFPEQYGEFSLHGEEWSYNDPQTEAAADLLEIAAGFASPQMKCETRGRDFEKIQEERAAARESNAKLGIPNVLPAHTRDEAPEAAAPVETGPTPEETKAAFSRDAVLAMMKDHPINRIIYNVTDVTTLLTDAGLPLDTTVMTSPGEGLPMLPIVAEMGPLVTGDTVDDPQGVLVGGDVELPEPVDVPATGAAVEPAKEPKP